MRATRTKASGSAVGFALVFAILCSSAQAASPLKIREVFPGSVAAGANAEYVELQMTAAGQGDIDGQQLSFYDAAGNPIGAATHTILADAANGESQRTVLLASQEAVANIPGFPAPNGDLGIGLNRLNPAGGAVCFTGAGAGADDCVTWGSIPLLSAPFPDPQSANAVVGGITNGFALHRSIAPGCSTYLEPSDDTDNSATDFALAAPSPKNNSTARPHGEIRCVPDTAINTFPPNPTNQSSATFTFAEVPDEPGIAFDCELDGNGSFVTAVPCDSGTITYPGPLSDGQHTFRVRAEGEGGVDSTPDAHTWTIDTIAPETTIDTTPPSPNSGFSVDFGYSSSEPLSSFRCQLDGQPLPNGQVCGTSTASASKSYFGLTDGFHTFRVWATDNAGNVDPTPAEHTFQVITAIGDFTPPDTSILSTPANPSRSSSASFSYASSEPGSTFQCSLGGAAFAPCPASGIPYADLANGTYTFAVRAIDVAGNVDSVPAAYTWTVSARAPSTRFTKAPSGAVRAKGKDAVAVRFGFVASETGSTFRCRLDLKGPYKRCDSPHSFKAEPGRHVFEVYAVDRLDNEGAPVFRIFRVQAEGTPRSFFTQSGRFLSSLTAEIAPTTLPREGLRPVSLRFGSTFENLDGTDIPALRTMELRLARGGVIQTAGLPRCAGGQLRLRTSVEALAVCRDALVGSGTLNTATRFPEGARVRSAARILLFNAGNSILMHIYTASPIEGFFIVPFSIARTPSGVVLRARFPRIAADYGHLTGFSMKLKRIYRAGGQRRSYLRAGCPIPRGEGNLLPFELAQVDYRFAGGLRIQNSSLNTCRAAG